MRLQYQEVLPRLRNTQQEMKVGIVGGGLAGLSTAWHLGNLGVSVTVIDQQAPGGAEASSVAGGLLHPLTPRNKLIWQGEQGLSASRHLLTQSKNALQGRDPLAAARVCRYNDRPDGGCILRPALTDRSIIDYKRAAQKLPQWLRWLEGDELTTRAGPRLEGALELKQSVIIGMSSYLRGLWLATEELARQRALAPEVRWQCGRISSLQSASQEEKYDAVVIAAGAGIRRFPELSKLPVEFVKGRSLLVGDWEKNQDGLKDALLCGDYVVPGLDESENRILLCGSTKEYVRDPWGRIPEEDPPLADQRPLEELREQANAIYPSLSRLPRHHAVTIGTRVSTRRSSAGRLPIVGRLPEAVGRNLWLFTGLGGRGLIHHAILGRHLNAIFHKAAEPSKDITCVLGRPGRLLAEAIVTGQEDVLPSEVRLGTILYKEELRSRRRAPS